MAVECPVIGQAAVNAMAPALRRIPRIPAGGSVVTDRIDSIADRAIAHTRALLKSDETEWSVARRGLRRIYLDLAAEAPGHPALDRLRAFIAEQDRVRGVR